jgi:hypothetical protein
MRLDNWPARLDTVVETRRNSPFWWGVNDCMLWPADVVLALTGKDPAVEFRNSYSTATAAMRIVKKHGGMEQLISKQLGFEPSLDIFPMRGDVVLFGPESKLCGGVCLGTQAAFVDKEGLSFISIASVDKRVWRIS